MPASPEQETVTFTLAKICPPACSISRPCIPKCCDLNKIYSPGLTTRRGCIPSNSFFNPPLYSSFTSKLPSKGVNDPLPHFILRKPRDFVTNCPDNSATIFPHSSKVASLLGRSINATMHAMSFRFRSPDGAFLLRDLIDKKCRVQKDLNNDICFDRITDWGGDFVEMNEDEMMVYLCSGWLVHGHVQVNFLFHCVQPDPRKSFMRSRLYQAILTKIITHAWVGQNQRKLLSILALTIDLCSDLKGSPNQASYPVRNPLLRSIHISPHNLSSLLAPMEKAKRSWLDNCGDDGLHVSHVRASGRGPPHDRDLYKGAVG